jgi:hypothetical protein
MLSILSLFLTQEEISNSIYVQTIRFTNVTIKKNRMLSSTRQTIIYNWMNIIKENVCLKF